MKSRMLLTIVALVVLASLVVVPAVSASALPGKYDGHEEGSMCTYKVVYGDTLSKIARRYDTDVWYLTKLNHLRNPNCIFAGQWLMVPCGHHHEEGCGGCGFKEPVKHKNNCDNWGCYAPKPTHYDY